MKRTFVNRIEELRTLHKALKYDGKENSVFVFTGIGGMGKTALRNAFEEELLRPKNIPYAVLDYDGDPNLRPIEASLRAIRRQLGRHKVKTPVFDFLYGRYFELSMGIKLTKDHFPSELDGVADILEGILAGIPIAGGVTQIVHGLTRLGLQAKERLQHKEWLYRIRDLEPREILNLLPEVLAGDLEEALSLQTTNVLKSSGSRLVLLFDAYELISESQLDDTLHRKLLLLTPHLLRVIFTRTPLPWEHTFPHEWQGKITHFPALDDLAHEDAMIFLRKKGIENPDLQNHLYELTGGYPMHLELCADIGREIKEATSREPGIPDFQGVAEAKDLTDELVRRLLRQLKDDERDLMCLAVYPRWVSDEVLEVLSSVPESVPRIFKKFIGLSMFSPHAEIPEAYVIRKEVRECLMLQQRKERLWKERHGKLSQFHGKRWEETQSSHHLREALHHSFYENSDEAIKMFEEHFWKILDEYRFAEAEALLEAVPAETLNEVQKRKIDYARARLLTTTARSQQSLQTARKLYETLVTTETDEEPLSQYFFYFGDLICEMSEYEKALEYFQKSLSIRLKIFREEHPDVASSYHNIGNVFRNLAAYEKALEFFQRSLSIRLKIFREEHPDVAGSYHNIGFVYHNLAEYEKALEFYQKSLSIKLKIFDKEHPNVGASYNNIGNVYLNLAEYEKALEFHQKSLSIKLKIFGEEHPQVAGSYNNIGCVYANLAEYEKARDFFQKGLSIQLKIFGEEHLQVADSYNNIGGVYQDLAEYEKALEFHQKSLAIWLKIFSEEHPRVANTYSNIGVVYENLTEYEKALEFYQKSLSIKLKIFGEEHVGVATPYHNIGCVYSKLTEYEKALEYHQKSLSIRLKIFGEEHPHVAESYQEVARTLWAMERKSEAFEKMRKSVEIYKKFKLWKKAVECLETLAGWLDEKGKHNEAEETRGEAQKIRQEYNIA